MTLAAEDLGLRAAVAQVPFSDGLASTLKIPPLTALRVTLFAVVDIVRSIPFYAPERRLAQARVPVFVAVAEQDSIAPAAPTARAAIHSSRVELVRYPRGHFDYYGGGDGFERAVHDELTFLNKHLA